MLAKINMIYRSGGQLFSAWYAKEVDLPCVFPGMKLTFPALSLGDGVKPMEGFQQAVYIIRAEYLVDQKQLHVVVRWENDNAHTDPACEAIIRAGIISGEWSCSKYVPSTRGYDVDRY